MVVLKDDDNPKDDFASQKASLDFFWNLSKAKNEKSRIDAAARIINADSKSFLETEYVLGRLIKGLATTEIGTRQGFFICLTELMRKSTVSYSMIEKEIINLKPAGKIAKGEESDLLLAQLSFSFRGNL